MTAEPATLLPCPFCGDEGVEGHIVDPEDPNDGGHFIQCTNGRCGASTSLRFASGNDPEPLLREQWNRRDPAAIVPDPEDEAQRDIVAEALGSGLVPDRFKIARAVLTALRDAARGAGG